MHDTITSTTIPQSTHGSADTPTRRRIGRSLLAIAVLSTAVATAVAVGAQASGASSDVAALQWFADERDGPVGGGAHTALKRSGDGIAVSIHARKLHPQHAYTAWFVLFNEPDGCVDTCGEDDLVRPEANASVVWTGAGGTAGPSGALNLRGRLGEGDPNPQGAETLFGPGLVDSRTAEVHIVIRDHGPASADPAVLAEQTTSFAGGCTPESSFGSGSGEYVCVDPQASVHPASGA